MNKFATVPTPKQPFSFTWSKIKNFETCPRRYYEIDVNKNFKEESPQLDYGFEMHEAAAKRVSQNKPLPEKFKMLEKWIQKFTKDSDDPAVGIQTELKLSIDKQMNPCSWFDKKTYMRGVIDFLKIRKKVALAVDWKSGEPKDDLIQLGLFAQLVFSHYNWIEAIRTMYVWTKTDDSTEETLYRKDMGDLWGEINPRVRALERAHQLDDFPPKKSGLCKQYCPVTTCEFNGQYSNVKN
jgi:CRISPR/Cas system-associated exonuclease Cas4 (RecB family)